jgi:hypothetical protein
MYRCRSYRISAKVSFKLLIILEEEEEKERKKS